MQDIYIKLAEMIVNIKSSSPFAERFCARYLCDRAEADITAKADRDEVLKEIEDAVGKTTFDYAEILCIYRHIAEKLPLFNRFVMHGAAINYGYNAYIFTAPSGTGKTTHLRLWQKYLGDKVSVINGDKPVLKVESGLATVYGTPWAGKENLSTNTSAPLKVICILKRGLENKIYKVDPRQYFAVLLNQIYLPKNEEAARKNLELFSRLVGLVEFYVLECDITEGAVKASFEAMTGEKYEIRGNSDED